MAAALFPASLRRRNGSLAPAEQLLAGKTHVMLYFSSHVRLPCRAFTSRLAKWYSTNETKQSVEIVLISQDRQASDFKKDVDSMPWVALPHDQHQLQEGLVARFQVHRLPRLIVLRADGSVVNADAHLWLKFQPEAFPWETHFPADATALSVLQSAAGLVNAEGKEVSANVLQGKQRWALYFTSLKSLPSSSYDVKLMEFYRSLHSQGREFEIVMVLFDKFEAEWGVYIKRSPWLSLRFDDPKVNGIRTWLQVQFGVDDKYAVDSTPSLVILDGAGHVIRPIAHVLVENDPTGARYPWPPAAWSPIEDLGPELMVTPTFVGWADAVDSATGAAVRQQVKEAVAGVAARFFEAKEETGLKFALASEEPAYSSRLRPMFGLEVPQEVDRSNADSVVFAIVDCAAQVKAVFPKKGVPSVDDLHAWVSKFLRGEVETMKLNAPVKKSGCVIC